MTKPRKLSVKAPFQRQPTIRAGRLVSVEAMATVDVIGDSIVAATQPLRMATMSMGSGIATPEAITAPAQAEPLIKGEMR